jgi:hypothetical protein
MQAGLTYLSVTEAIASFPLARLNEAANGRLDPSVWCLRRPIGEHSIDVGSVAAGSF